MLALRIIGTIILALNALWSLFVNINLFGKNSNKPSDSLWVIIPTAIGWAWRAFVIVILWII